MKLLIVEDDLIVAQNLKEILQANGHTVTGMVDSGEKAILEVERFQPDLILMDIRLNGRLDGIETAIMIHRSKEVPIVFVTAYPAHHFPNLGRMRPSLFRYITKPCGESELLSALKELHPI